MTTIDIVFLILLPSLLLFLVGWCFADHSRRWDKMSEEEKQKIWEQQQW